MSMYFTFLTDLLFVPRALFLLKHKNKVLYKILTYVCVLIVILAWYYNFVLKNGSETVPYRSKILGI